MLFYTNLIINKFSNKQQNELHHTVFRTQKPRKWVICHKLYSEKQEEFPILATSVCNIKFKGFFVFKKTLFPLIIKK